MDLRHLHWRLDTTEYDGPDLAAEVSDLATPGAAMFNTGGIKSGETNDYELSIIDIVPRRMFTFAVVNEPHAYWILC